MRSSIILEIINLNRKMTEIIAGSSAPIDGHSQRFVIDILSERIGARQPGIDNF